MGVLLNHFTVILQVAFLPFFVVAVIVAVPFFFAVIFPFLFTVATLLLLVLHVMLLLLVFDGETVALTVSVFPTPRVALFLLSVTFDASVVYDAVLSTDNVFLPKVFDSRVHFLA